MPERKHNYTEFAGILYACRSFKLFLARMVGFAAIVYGAATLSAYYFTLGVAAVVLFWVWDRMQASDMRRHGDLPSDLDTDAAQRFSGEDDRARKETGETAQS